MYQDHTLFTIPVDGTELSAYRWGRTEAPATVIYVHGGLGDSTVWTPLIRTLHEHFDGGIAQIAFDQRGYGSSPPASPFRETDMAVLADDLDTVLTAAHGATILAAHSTGSLLVQAWAERFPRHATAVAGLVLFGGAAEFPEMPCLPANYRRFFRRLCSGDMGALALEPAVGAMLLRSYLRRPGCVHPTDSALLSGVRCVGQRVMTEQVRIFSRYRITDSVVEMLRGVPTFVATGEHDRIVPPAQALRFAETIWAEIDLIPEAGHWLPHTAPQRAAEVLTRALELAYRADIGRSLFTAEEPYQALDNLGEPL
ncbi:alpha/beta hydrolase [Nocardia sp. CDC159]|uniref:Alpha/beta hydrolase n=1 Tax=Nocardia pulmonis TaxID=2951408 RepID=A0A9X2E507_9NOCA|nr:MULTISPECIES: alpha/beta hydrolase [Nocardia]MCM6774417.1 alpha/beta hydrolase [Nocardia pulmonis]MCM6787517.1 alpha/beta hydrolase [Nocardia sp. CDC159]